MMSTDLCHKSQSVYAKSSRFGNFIGEPEPSEEESQNGVDAAAYTFDEEPEAEVNLNDQGLMEVDGRIYLCLVFCTWRSLRWR